MTRPKRGFEKKSEMLEVRLSLSEKQALAAHCRDKGISASELVRDLVSTRVRTPVWRRFLQPKGTGSMPDLSSMLPGAAAITLAGSLALAVAAPSTASDYRSAFDMLDANSDGSVTLEEFLDHDDGYLPQGARDREDGRIVTAYELAGELRQEFALYDRNRNGLMTYEEFSGRYASMIEVAFEHFDANADGQITAAELDGGTALDAPVGDRLIADFDADRSGALSFDEFSGRDG